MKRLWVVTLVALACTVGCTKPNPSRCCIDEADCAAKEIPIGSLCEDGLVCRGNQCIAQPCASNDSCDPAAPFCIDELCAELCVEDAHCPGFGGEATTPYCIQGDCVACRDSADCTSATAAFCEAGTCRACVAHSECASELCDVDTGTCLDETTIVYVAPAGSASSSCTKTDPCSLDRASAVADATRTTVKLAEGTHIAGVNSGGGGLWAITTPNVSFYGPATISGPGGLSIGTPGTLKLRDLELGKLQYSAQLPSMLDAARISIPDGFIHLNARATLRDVRLAYPVYDSNRGSQILTVSSDSQVTLTRVEIIGGNTGMDVGNNASVTVTNSIIRDQWKIGPNAPNAIRYNASALPSTVSFTTFYNTRWDCTTYDSIVYFQSRNNIFINDLPGAPVDTVGGEDCTHHYDIIKPQGTAPIGANNLLNSDPHFVNAAGGDFHLTTGSIAIDAADPAAAESVDFDGTMRPQGVGRDIGAFEYKP